MARLGEETLVAGGTRTEYYSLVLGFIVVRHGYTNGIRAWFALERSLLLSKAGTNWNAYEQVLLRDDRRGMVAWAWR